MRQNPSTRIYDTATTLADIEKRFAVCLRDNLFDGREQVVIEPFNGPRPKGCYASVQVASVNTQQHEVRDYVLDDVEADDIDAGMMEPAFLEVVKGEKYIRLRLQFFNSGARQKAVDAQNLLKSSNRNFDIMPVSGISHVGDVNDITTEYMGKIEERAYIDVEIYALLSAEYEVTNIERAGGDIISDAGKHEYRLGGDACKLTFGHNLNKGE